MKTDSDHILIHDRIQKEELNHELKGFFMANIEQKIAQKEAELARLKAKARKLETGQKIIIGGMMLSLAKNDANIAELLLNKISNEIIKDADKKRIESVIDELKRTIAKSNQQLQHI